MIGKDKKKIVRQAKSKSTRVHHLHPRILEAPFNNLDEQIPEWFDERTLTGNLFILFSVDGCGMPLVRALPSEEITEILTRDNDYRQETGYKTGSLDQE